MWDKEDAKRHTRKARSEKQKRMWKEIANSVLDRGGDDGSAIRQANAVVARRSKKR